MSTAPPVLDVEPLLRRGAAGAPPSLLQDVEQACREWGFFQIVGHGVSEERLASFDRALRGFFALSASEKDALRRTAGNVWGYTDRELTRQTRDWKEIFDFGRSPRPELPDAHPDNHGPEGWNRWPTNLPGFESVVKAHYADCEGIAGPLLETVCVTLGAPPGVLRADFAQHSSFLRLNHYPPCDDPAAPDATDAPPTGQLGVNRHSDAGALTLLYQDEVPALQVSRGGRFVVVEPLAGALVVNLGDMLQVWSNDRYPAPLHRVLASATRDRVSAPFFYNPSYETLVAPLAATLSSDRPARYRPVPWGAFRARRAAGDYADLGEEVQVGQYRTPGSGFVSGAERPA
jgi:isopenicillin N synthase-like dioxygenase